MTPQKPVTETSVIPGVTLGVIVACLGALGGSLTAGVVAVWTVVGFQMDPLEAQLAALKEDVGEVKGEMKDVRGEFKELAKEMRTRPVPDSVTAEMGSLARRLEALENP